MNATLVNVATNPSTGHSRRVVVPIAIPDLEAVHTLAQQLHVAGEPFHGTMWGWEVTYEPECDEPDAVVEVPDGKGTFVAMPMALWTPASFTIGESGVWFYSLQWEQGANEPPVAFLDDRSLV